MRFCATPASEVDPASPTTPAAVDMVGLKKNPR